MIEPKTVADAKRLTLAKIKKCMKRPYKERPSYWADNYICHFCSLIGSKGCSGCPARKPCDYRFSLKKSRFTKQCLRKLYRMVKEIEV